MNIINEIKIMRRDLGMSQQALGVYLSRNRDHIKDIENGRKRPLAEDYLKIKALYEQLQTKPKEKEQ